MSGFLLSGAVCSAVQQNAASPRQGQPHTEPMKTAWRPFWCACCGCCGKAGGGQKVLTKSGLCLPATDGEHPDFSHLLFLVFIGRASPRQGNCTPAPEKAHCGPLDEVHTAGAGRSGERQHLRKPEIWASPSGCTNTRKDGYSRPDTDAVPVIKCQHFQRTRCIPGAPPPELPPSN